jgi:16S rRNA (cytosine967-C5)-methyltransferase
VARPRRPAAGKRVQTSQESVRAAAGWVLERTLASFAPVDTFLDGALARFEPRDQRLLGEVVLGTLRWLRRIDSVVALASDRSLDRIDPALLTPLRIAVYQLLFLDRVPSHAAVNEAVDLAGRKTHRGGASFVNAVLRRIARAPQLERWPVQERDPVRRLAVEWSHPDFLVERWVERFGRDTAIAILQANNRPKPLHLLAFKDRGGRELLAESLIDSGVEVDPSWLSPMGLIVRGGDPFATGAFARGDFYVQDEASQIAAVLPAPSAGERVLDAAAAPGGKTFSLQACEPGVRVVAADVDPARLRVLSENARRLGRELPMVVADGAMPPWRAAEGGPIGSSASSAAGDAAGPRTGFDRVVLDLPCTGTGTLRKHPELKWRISPEEVGRLSRLALRMLDGAAPSVAEGGLLVAITCSLEAEENEDVVARFLHRHRDFAPEALAEQLAPPVSRAVRGPGFVRIYPAGDHDGFSIHVLRRAAPESA